VRPLNFLAQRTRSCRAFCEVLIFWYFLIKQKVQGKVNVTDYNHPQIWILTTSILLRCKTREDLSNFYRCSAVRYAECIILSILHTAGAFFQKVEKSTAPPKQTTGLQERPCRMPGNKTSEAKRSKNLQSPLGSMKLQCSREAQDKS